MKDTDDIDELYKWINSRYEEYAEGNITEEEYLKELEYYKQKLAESHETPKIQQENDKSPSTLDPDKVRSTSIAGLRKKLLEEMKK